MQKLNNYPFGCLHRLIRNFCTLLHPQGQRETMDVFEQILRSNCYCISRRHERASISSSQQSLGGSTHPCSDDEGSRMHHLNANGLQTPPTPSIPNLQRCNDMWCADVELVALLALKSCMMPLLSMLTSAGSDRGRATSLISHVIYRAVTPPLQQLFGKTNSGVRDDRYALVASCDGIFEPCASCYDLL